MKKAHIAACDTYLVCIAVLLILCVNSVPWPNSFTYASHASSNEAKELIEEAKKLRKEGDIAKTEGRHDEAVTLYSEAASLYEKARTLDVEAFHSFNYSGLAECYQEVGQYDKAIAVIKDGIVRMEETGKETEAYLLHLDLADIYQEMGNYDKALEIYESQRAFGRNSIDWYQGLAGLYEQMGDTEAARAIYVSAFDALAFDFFLYRRCADFLIKNNYLEDAEEATYKAIVAFQDEPIFLPEPYKNLLTIYEKQGRSNETLDWIRLKIEETEKKAEEFWEQPTPEEKEFHRALTWFIIVVLLVTAIVISIIAFLIRRRVKMKKGQEESLS